MKRYLFPIIFLIALSSCSSIPSITVMPPNTQWKTEEEKKEYYEYMDWQRQLNMVMEGARKNDAIAFWASTIGLISAGSTAFLENDAKIPAYGVSALGLLFYFVGESGFRQNARQYDELIQKGKLRGWVLE